MTTKFEPRNLTSRFENDRSSCLTKSLSRRGTFHNQKKTWISHTSHVPTRASGEKKRSNGRTGCCECITQHSALEENGKGPSLLHFARLFFHLSEAKIPPNGLRALAIPSLINLRCAGAINLSREMNFAAPRVRRAHDCCAGCLRDE